MKKLLITFAALALMASQAFALAPGISLSAGNACPGDGGTTDGGTIDCAGLAGIDVVHVYAVFIPAENNTSSAYDAIYDIGVQGDLLSTAAFWNQETCNPPPTGMNASGVRGVGCTTPVAYLNVYTGGAGAAGAVISSNHARLSISAARAGTLAITTAQRIFGHDITWDPAASTEGNVGGQCAGCAVAVCIVQNAGKPRSPDSSPAALHSPSADLALPNQVFFNGGGGLCGAVPTKKRTWGQLKSLYR